MVSAACVDVPVRPYRFAQYAVQPRTLMKTTAPESPKRFFQDESLAFAEEFARCQDAHRALMQALYDNAVDAAMFRELCLKQQDDLLRLKRMKLDLKEKRLSRGGE